MLEKLEIMTPAISDAEAMIRLRTDLLRKEMVLAGLSEQSAYNHTADWTSQTSISEYEQIIGGWLNDPQRYLRIAKQAGKVAGIFIADLAFEEQPAHYVSTIQLDEPIRRRGIGTMLINNLAQEHPDSAIELEVLEGNSPARHFYERLGFKPVGELMHTLIFDGHLVPAIRLRKDIL